MSTLTKLIDRRAGRLDDGVQAEHGDGVVTAVQGQYARVRKTGQTTDKPGFLIVPGMDVQPGDLADWFERGQKRVIVRVTNRNAILGAGPPAGSALTFDVADYQQGDGDSAALQRAVNAGRAGYFLGGGKKVVFGTNLTLTATIELAPVDPATLKFFQLDIEGLGGAQIFWDGPDSVPVFHSVGWKSSRITNVPITIPTGKTGVLAWSLDTTATSNSTSNLTFENSPVKFATGATSCKGWILGAEGAGTPIRDVSQMTWVNCFAIAVANTDGNVGWDMHHANVLANTWVGCGGFFLGKMFDESAATGGGASGYFYGCLGGYNLVDFKLRQGGNAVHISGGRWEVGNRFIDMAGAITDGNVSGRSINLHGVDIHAYTPADGTLFAINHPARLSIKGSMIWSSAANYGASLFLLGGSPTAYGVLDIEDCAISAANAADPLWTISATRPWQVRVSNVQRLDASVGSLGLLPDRPVTRREYTFAETSGDGTYTQTVPLPAGAMVFVTFRNTALWTAGTSASLVVGDDDDANGYIEATDLKTAPIADVNGAGAGIATRESLGATVGVYKGGAGKYCATAKTLTATITKVGTGTAGRSRLVVEMFFPSPTPAVAKV